MNIVAVGASLAAITGVIFSLLFHERSVIPLVTALPTLLFGTLWAKALRWEKTLPGTNLRWGWLASIVLAALNGGAAVGLLFAFERNATGWADRLARFIGGLVIGATFGAIAWVPALVVTLVVFGLPIAWAQNQAKKGLSGQERGEGIVGGASALIALTALLLSIPVDSLRGDTSLHINIVRLLAVAASALGAAAMYTARARPAAAAVRRRRRARRGRSLSRRRHGRGKGPRARRLAGPGLSRPRLRRRDRRPRRGRSGQARRARRAHLNRWAGSSQHACLVAQQRGAQVVPAAKHSP